MARVRRNGGTAEEFIGRSEPGVQARVPVVTSEGANKVQDVRFVGLDGPGLLLRGTITGTGAVPGSTDAWSCGMRLVGR
ncbi:DUF3710 domain-containing protein [Streptomyces sp. NPDC059340]|uniref:DUF3710 domain-containing protein n=1 Tax=Streptomyces sp. NPDC059340 TaxID=3346806 RepID=UPI00367BCC57